MRERRQGNPTLERVIEALETIETHELPGTPSARHLKVLDEVAGTSWRLGDRRIERFSVNKGRPEHGAFRSDDHVGVYRIEAPLNQFKGSKVGESECPNCASSRAVFDYWANHFIAGGESIVCPSCEHVYYEDEWE